MRETELSLSTVLNTPSQARCGDPHPTWQQYCLKMADKFNHALGTYATAEDDTATTVNNTGGSF